MYEEEKEEKVGLDVKYVGLLLGNWYCFIVIFEFFELESKVISRKGGMRRCRFVENVGSKLFVEERGECFC